MAIPSELRDVGAFERISPFSWPYGCAAAATSRLRLLQKIDNPEPAEATSCSSTTLSWSDIKSERAHLNVRLTSQWPESAIQIRTKPRACILGEWYHVAVTYDGSGKAAGLALYINGKLHKLRGPAGQSLGPIETDAELQIGEQVTGQAVSEAASTICDCMNACFD